MRRASVRIVCMLLATAMVATTAPLVAGAKVSAEAVSAQGVGTYATDIYEGGVGDDYKAAARDVTALFADFGEWPYQEPHTLDIATGLNGDQDWFKFTVTADDLISKRGFLIEAFTNHNSTDPVIEIYSSSAVPSTTPAWNADPATLPNGYRDDGPWIDYGPSLSFMPYVHSASPATYYFRVRPYSNSGKFWDNAGPYVLRLKKGLLERIAGVDRIDTAIEISKEEWRAEAPMGRNRAVVIANGYNFPDALAGAVLCGIGNGPMLLTPQSYLPESVKMEVERLGAQHVFVLGGEGAVAPAVVTCLQSISPTISVVRLQGDTRIQTAMEVALASRSSAAHFNESTPTVAIVVNSEAWADALAAAPLATYRNVPILLTPKDYLHPDTAEALYHLGATDVIIVGGTGVVAPAVETSLAAQMGGAGHVLRVAGDNRYETAKKFATWACDLTGPGTIGDGGIGTLAAPTILGQMVENHIGVASGENYPDALAGGPMCGRLGYPLLLTPKNPVEQVSYIFESHELALPTGDTDYFSDIGGGHVAIESSRLFGGPGAVSDGMFLELDQFFGFTGP